MTEYDPILMEAYCTFRADEYFKERTYLDNKTYRRVFDAAFQLGWEAHNQKENNHD